MEEIKVKTYDGDKIFSPSLIKKASNQKSAISIIIRTKNEEENIAKCIEMINKQEFSLKYNIIIIDSESDDKTISIAKKYDVTIYSIPKEQFGFGSSISLGLSLCNSKYCVFLSAHAIPKNQHWLENLVNKFDDTTAAVYSKQIPNLNANFIEKRALTETFGEFNRIQKWNNNFKKYSDYKNEIAFSNASCCIKREVAQQIPFRDILASEDREWAKRILIEGYTIKYASDSIVYHSHNESIEKYYNRIFINSKSLYQFTGVKLNFYHFIPLMVLNIYLDINYILKNHDKLSFNKIKMSVKYRYYYCLAHYKATR